MNLKEDIISRGIGYEGNNFQTNYFLSNLAKGFIKDKEIFGEDVVSLYSDIFGQESLEKSILLSANRAKSQ